MRTADNVSISLTDLLYIVGAIFVAGIAGTVYIFTTFLTVGDAEMINKRLDSIEKKIDIILEKEMKRKG